MDAKTLIDQCYTDPEFSTFLSDLIAFVEKSCDGRDPSHGSEHSESVGTQSLIIYGTDGGYPCDMDFVKMLVTVAYLHDINDAKYDKENLMESSMRAFLASHFKEIDIDTIMKIIARISYSKENNCRKEDKPLDWNQVLDPRALQIRDIVSDADKLEAIGKIGLKRCRQYTQARNRDIDEATLNFEVIKHFEEKLGRLLPEGFIRTPVGRKMAEPLHQEMLDMIEKMRT